MKENYMKLIITKEIAEKYPHLRIGVLLGKGLLIQKKMDELEKLKQQKAADFRQKYNSDTLLSNPNISAWREIYRSFGVKPKRYKPTAEALLRRLIKGEEIPTINTAVDSYLVVEVEYLLPVGGYDLDKVSGNIKLRISPGEEPFQPLGNINQEETTNKGEVIYSDNKQVLTRKWNFRDCNSTKITLHTKTIGLFIEGAEKDIETKTINKSLEKLQEYIKNFCGGETKIFIADVRDELEWVLL